MSTPTYAPETPAADTVAPDAHIPDGTDLLVQELREEFAHLVRHPIEELKRLEHVAADGDSPTTPLLTRDRHRRSRSACSSPACWA